jgi:hypothetical protein
VSFLQILIILFAPQFPYNIPKYPNRVPECPENYFHNHDRPRAVLHYDNVAHRSALATLGLETVSTGYWTHDIILFVMRYKPVLHRIGSKYLLFTGVYKLIWKPYSLAAAAKK